MVDIILTTIQPVTGNVTTNSSAADWFKFDDPAQRIVVAVLFITASIVGTIGNSLVITAVFVSRKLRTTTNVFVVNLAVADLLTSLFVPWNAVALLSRDGWPLPPWVCSVAGAIMYLCIAASLYSLASIALNRLILVTKDFRTYQRVFATSYLVIWLILIWAVSFMCVIFLPVVGVGSLGYNEKYGVCSQSSDNPKDDIYQLVQAVAILPVPLVIICFCYGKIFVHIRRHILVMSAHLSQAPETTQTDVSSAADSRLPARKPSAVTSAINCVDKPELRSEKQDGEHGNAQPELAVSGGKRNDNGNIHKNGTRAAAKWTKRTSSVSRRQLQITKNMFIIVCTFFICLAPFTFCLFYDDSDPFVPYASAIVLCNSCINPFIYATKHPVFKSVFLAIVKCRLRDVPEPATALHRLVMRKI